MNVDLDWVVRHKTGHIFVPFSQLQSLWTLEQSLSVIKQGHVLGRGQVTALMFVRVSQPASECCPERGQIQSLLANEIKIGLFVNSMPTITWNYGNFMK
jgi:hypothetical protein